MAYTSTMNYASKYSNKVDERFTRDSQALAGTNKDYEWSGVKTVIVYQVDTVPLVDYVRGGANRYGTPLDLGNSIQSMTVTQDKSFTFVIDKGDRDETMMVMEAGKSLAREQREVVVPFFDKYIFMKQAGGAIAAGHVDMTAASSTTAYAKFLKGQEVLGNADVPDTGRIAYCSYAFANLLMQDPAFIKYGDSSQNMTIKGTLGEVDGVRIVKVPASRLPLGCSFLLVHPSATVAPKKLEEYKTHKDPPGISGDLVEGRFIMDAFILNGKAKALYIGMCSGELGSLTASVDPVTNAPIIDKSQVPDGAKYYVRTGSALPAFGDDVTGWTEIDDTTTITATSVVAAAIDDGTGTYKIIGAGVVTI